MIFLKGLIMSYFRESETFDEEEEGHNNVLGKLQKNTLKRFSCANSRCDQDIICEGDQEFYCSRECYHIKLELDNLESEGKSLIFKHISLKGRGGTGLLSDRNSVDHLHIQVNQFGRFVKVQNTGANAVRWRKSIGGAGNVKDNPDGGGRKKVEDEEKQRLKALLNMEFEDSSDEDGVSESEKETEDTETVLQDAHEEIQTLLSSGSNANVCPLHQPLTSVHQLGEKIQVYTINVISPWEIYVQTIHMIQKTHEIDAICNRAEGIDHRLILKDWRPEVGSHCRAKFEDTFYRAKILKKKDDGSFEVKFVDYGNTEIVQASDLRQLDPELTLVPRQCICFKISNAKPNDSKRWSEEARNFTIKSLDGASVELVLDTVEQQIIHLGKLNVIQSISGEILGDFGEALVERKFAEPDSFFIPEK